MKIVRVCVVSQSLGLSETDKGIGRLEELTMQIANDHPDFICFPELCACNAGKMESAIKNQAHEMPGPFTKEVGRIAQQAGAVLIVPALRRLNGRVYNSVPFVASDGTFAGAYHKMYPTPGELELGISPGQEAPVFEVNGVRVGAAVCFDLNFADVGEQLANNRARLVFWPSMYWGGRLLHDWSLRYGFYLATAYGAESAVVDMSGKFLVQHGYGTPQVAAGRLPPWVTIPINVDREMFHLDYNQDKLGKIRKKYGPDIVFDLHQPEAYFTMASVSEHFTVEDVIAEFQLETLRAYMARSRKMRAARKP